MKLKRPIDRKGLKLSNTCMASILDTIKQAVTNTGASALRAVSSINPQLGGQLGHAVDVVGTALKNPFPEAYASELAQSTGGVAEKNAIQSNTTLTQAQKDAQLKALEDKAKATAGFNSASGLPPDKGGTQNNGSYTDPEPGGFGNSANPDLSNDYKKKKYEEWLKTQNQNKPDTSAYSAGDVSKAITDNPDAFSFLGENDLKALMDKYAGKAKSSAGDLAGEIERVATENADREYSTVKDALGVQKQEVQTVAGEQAGKITQQKELGLSELTDKQDTETQNIEKQKLAFEGDTASTADTLARNWRDMSLQVQRIMRARGTSDSSFSAKAETDVLLDFNKGLRTLAKQSTDAVANFADAVTETTKFYTREKNKLEVDAGNQLQDVDTWVRQQVQSIQGQENMALTKKLNDIRSAISQGNQLKIQVEQSINDKQFALDSWVVQTQVNYKNAVALAGQGKTADAQKQISDYRTEAIKNNDLLLKGGYQLDTTTVNGASVPVLHGYLPDGSVDTVYLTPQGADQLKTNQQNYSTGKLTPTDQIIQTAQNSTTPSSAGGGLLESLANMFK